jgi:hypothetical protein
MSRLQFLRNPTATSGLFAGMDTSDYYKNNLQKMPDDWHYRTKEIYYKTNTLNYRTVDFENVSWKDSVVVFGCSNVFGIGLAEDETIDYQLSLLLDCPVINMGAGGTSMMFSLHNQLVLHNIEQPKAIINMWTGIERLTIFDKDKAVNITAHSHNHFSKELFKLWNYYPTHSLSFSLMLQQMSVALWKDIPHVEVTLFESTANDLNCEFLRWEDKARDLQHPGPVTILNAAKSIAKRL